MIQIAYINAHSAEGKTVKLILSCFADQLYLTFKVVGPGSEYSQLDYLIKNEDQGETIALINAMEEAYTGTDMRDVINEFYHTLQRIDMI